ncbi:MULTISPECIES: 4-oxalomesaconate tautomerase [unclassified Halomonas]|uniref:4-oxalomesaconate tautomerase n=1 Tax=unclassified Halomonas TaxID=2609666 RepID=UPI00209F83EE|nr:MULTISPECIES: 4-oxalomesaconate tautomerase [unclassified Halomonas]MCP1313729.1 4-oxalomesaconate tautomerase [Halomonas sp. 707D7]MCP1325811.1 4-oxalomesaconate tautomerase [Halomonas sp. 707D4]
MNSIPCVIMRGGTSRGPFIRMKDLPDEPEQRAEILLSLMGSGHALQIDGIGGGDPLTSKVAIVERSTHPEADVDYLFAQVDVVNKRVDFNPNCGNMLSAVGPYAIESGLVEPCDGMTVVRVHNLNTQRLIECQVPTPSKQVEYEGNVTISGVPGSAAGIQLSFLDIMGSKTGQLLPTGHARETIADIEVSCIDAATPVMLLRASSVGLSGHETPAELDANTALLERLESLRLEAGQRMGLGDVSESVLPKIVLVSDAQEAAHTLDVRYFVPHRCHKSIAVTGAMAVAAAINVPESVAHQMATASDKFTASTLLSNITLKHPSGSIELTAQYREQNAFDLARISVVRTARKIMSGQIFYATPANRQDQPVLETSD